MESKPHLSAREIRILLTYGLAFAVVGILFLLLSWLRAGAPTNTAEPYHAEIAVLVPVEGDGSENGKAIVDTVLRSTKNIGPRLKLDKWNIVVRIYDTGTTPQSTAWAAYNTARNPNTVAIIGPLDARQIVAAKNSLLGREIPIITVASTAPILDVSTTEGVYRIPTTDDRQGPAIVSYLQKKAWTNVFLLVESSAYTKNVLSKLQSAAKDKLKFIKSVEIKPTDQKVAGLDQIDLDKTDAIIYLGGTKGLGLLIEGLQNAKVHIPVIGIDSINDTQVSKLLAGGQELYFTSPINLNAFRGEPYQGLSAAIKSRRYGVESIQATWLVLQALSSSNHDGMGASAVWQNLDNAVISGAFGEDREWKDGQLQPETIYVFHGTKNEIDWFHTVVEVIRLR